MARAVGLALVALFALCLSALAARAAEEITAFNVSIVLGVDGTVKVTETLTVTAEGREIRRGIFRDIPTTLLNPDGSRLRSALTVESVTRNGRAEPYSVERIAGGTRIRIGDAARYLIDGPHRYVITYTMTRMARMFESHDELYWNATGNYWNFPILRASAVVTLPDGAVISDLVGYTGRMGATEQAVTIERLAANQARFTATRRLAPGEGMSVVAAFQKGVLTEPGALQQALNWLSDHRDLVLPLIAVLIVLLYNYFAWDAVGRDPRKGTIIPRFYPPKGFSPALVHYVREMGWKQNGWLAFTASIFDLGVKGLVTIDNRGKSLSVTVTGKEPEERLPVAEKVVFDYLRAQGTVKVDKTTGPTLNTKRGEFVTALESENRQVYFRNNTGYVIVGAVIALAALGTLVLTETLDIAWLIVAVVGGVALGMLASAFHAMWSGPGFSRFVAIVWVAILGFNFIPNAGSWWTDISFDTGLVAALSIVLISVVFAILLRAPTVQGRKVMDEIDGFRMYLETAEKERLNFEGEPPLTATRFERILPYAIALGVEKPWSERFEAELARNAISDAQPGYQPAWYRGSWSTGSGGFSNAATTVASGMSAAMIAAQPVSSSSSGGGGGGFSGGGGGGGGGGGW